MSELHELETEIDALWELPPDEAASRAGAVEQTIDLLDRGAIRVAEKTDAGWVAREWVKKAILLFFRLRQSEPVEIGPFTYLDKIPVKRLRPRTASGSSRPPSRAAAPTCRPASS